MTDFNSRAFITHTFSECVENHAGMETVGEKRKCGFSEYYLTLHAAKHGGEVHMLKHGNEEACVVVFREGVNHLIGKGGDDSLLKESMQQDFDKRFLNTRRKLVQNLHGRFNNCYAEEAQKPDIEAGKGTIISFKSTPVMEELRSKLPSILGNEAYGLLAETNFYPDVTKKKVGIGFHGDSERSVVVGVRLGAASMPLRFQWYHRSRAVSEERSIALNHGDIYAMSWKATGHDWKYSSKTTLRHGTGRKATHKDVVK